MWSEGSPPSCNALGFLLLLPFLILLESKGKSLIELLLINVQGRGQGLHDLLSPGVINLAPGNCIDPRDALRGIDTATATGQFALAKAEFLSPLLNQSNQWGPKLSHAFSPSLLTDQTEEKEKRRKGERKEEKRKRKGEKVPPN